MSRTTLERRETWENAYSDGDAHQPLADELLNRKVFANPKEAQVLTGDYRELYNQTRPHGALGYITPAEFASCQLHYSPAGPSRFPYGNVITLCISTSASTLATAGLRHGERRRHVGPRRPHRRTHDYLV